MLSADEVVRFLEAVSSLKSRAALTTAYAAGLRVSEVAGLKIADIDSGRMVIRIEHGKGGKDRYVMLSPQLLGILRALLASGAAKARFCFPGRDERQADRARPCCTPPAVRRVKAAGLTSGSPCIRCATASRRICWRTAPTSGSSRFCSATSNLSTTARYTQVATHTDRARPKPAWIGCRWR